MFHKQKYFLIVLLLVLSFISGSFLGFSQNNIFYDEKFAISYNSSSLKSIWLSSKYSFDIKTPNFHKTNFNVLYYSFINKSIIYKFIEHIFLKKNDSYNFVNLGLYGFVVSDSVNQTSNLVNYLLSKNINKVNNDILYFANFNENYNIKKIENEINKYKNKLLYIGDLNKAGLWVFNNSTYNIKCLLFKFNLDERDVFSAIYSKFVCINNNNNKVYTNLFSDKVFFVIPKKDYFLIIENSASKTNISKLNLSDFNVITNNINNFLAISEHKLALPLNLSVYKINEQYLFINSLIANGYIFPYSYDDSIWQINIASKVIVNKIEEMKNTYADLSVFKDNNEYLSYDNYTYCLETKFVDFSCALIVFKKANIILKNLHQNKHDFIDVIKLYEYLKYFSDKEYLSNYFIKLQKQIYNKAVELNITKIKLDINYIKSLTLKETECHVLEYCQNLDQKLNNIP